ncbi:hypothetical protein PV325_007106, partial [Microctonus aethiopoides]
MFIMDQVIRTGFEKIRHNIAFQPQTEPKGKALVESGHVIDSNCVIVNASCTCVYNKSEECKYIAALIYLINHEESLSKTDKEQNWGKPSVKQLAKEKYSKGKFFFEMRKTPKIINKIPKSVSDKSSILEMEKPSALKWIAVEMNKDKDFKLIQNLLSEMVQSIDSNLKFEDCRIYISKEQNIKLACDTLDQSNRKDWFLARRKRISA